jgi:glycosyltransferase involved in cell wall biosynthesis
LSRQLIKNGHSVDLHCIGHTSDLAPFENSGGIAIYRHPSDPFYKAPRFRLMKRAWPTIFKYAFHVRRIAQEKNYDVLILNQWPLLHAVTLPKAQRRKTVLHWCEIRHGLFYRMIQNFLPRMVSRNVAVSDAVGRSIQCASSGMVHTLPSGIDNKAYGSLPRAQRSGICYLGRMADHKNIPLLIEAFELLKNGGYAGGLTLAGDGPALGEIRERVRKSPYASDIFLPGLITDNDKVLLLSKSEALVISSVREGFPRVVAEAMASGLPIVTSDFPENGTKEVVLSYDSGVVTPPTASDLALGITRALENWDRYSEAGHIGARSLSWDLIAKTFEDLVVPGIVEKSKTIAPRLTEVSPA